MFPLMIWAAVYCEQLTEMLLKRSQQPRSPSVSTLEGKNASCPLGKLSGLKPGAGGQEGCCSARSGEGRSDWREQIRSLRGKFVVGRGQLPSSLLKKVGVLVIFLEAAAGVEGTLSSWSAGVRGREKPENSPKTGNLT